MENATSNPAPKRRRWGFYLKLGAILVLAPIVIGAALVYFAPSMIANTFKGFAESAFADQFQGRVAVGKLDLSWSNPQTIESVKLFDPSGAAVLEAKVSLPSIRALLGREKLGKIRIELSGDLSADDAGLTNLERAIAAKVKAAETKSAPPSTTSTSTSSASSGDWRADAKKVDVEVEIVASHLTWSDAHTRAAGQPIRLENLNAVATLEHGERATMKLASQLIAGSPHPVKIDAKIEHPFELPSSATPPKADVQVNLDGFPSGFVDGLGRFGGKLTQVLGDTFDLDVHAAGTLQAGDASIALKSPHADLKFDGRLEGGILRGSQTRALSIAFDPDAKALDTLIRGALPAGSSLARSSQNRLELDVDDLELPIARLADLEKSHEDPIAVLTQTAKATIALELGDWSYRDAKLAGQSKSFELVGLHCKARLGSHAAVPGVDDAWDEPGMLDISIGARSRGASNDDKSIQLETNAAQLLGAMSGGALGEVANVQSGRAVGGCELKADLNAPLDLVGVWAGESAKRLSEFGSSVHVTIDSEVALAAQPGVRSQSFGVADLARLDTISSVVVECIDDSHAFEFAWRPRLEFQLDLARNGVGSVWIAWPILRAHETGKGMVKVSSDQWTGAISNPLRTPIVLNIDTGSIEAKVIEHFIGTEAKLSDRLGEWLAIKCDARGTFDALDATLRLESPLHHATVAAKWHDKTLFESGEGVRIESKLDSALVDALLAGSLPPNAKLAMRSSPQTVSLALKKFTVPLAPWLDRTPGAPLDLKKQLAGVELAAELALGDWSWSDAALAKAGARLDLKQLAAKLELHTKDGALATSTELSGRFGDDAASAFTAKLEADDALSLSEVGAKRAFAPLHVVVDAPRVPASIVDAYAGGGGAIAKQLGAQFGVALDLHGAWKPKESIALQSTLGLDAQSKPTKITIDATLADPFAAQEHGLLPDARAKLDVAGTQFLSALAPEAWRAIVADALGNAITIAVSNKTREKGGQDVSLGFDAPGAKIAFAGSIENQVLRTNAREHQDISVPIKAAMLDLVVGAKLPKGSKLALAKEGDPFAISISGLELPLDAWLAPKSADPKAAAQPVSLAAQLDRMRALVTVSVPGLVFTQPAAKAGDPPTTISISNLKLDAVGIEPGKLVSAQMNGNVDATPPGTIDVRITGEHPFAFLPDAPATLKPAMHIKGKLAGVPTALVDALAAQDGLVLDVLGPSLAVDVAGSWPTVPGEAIQASLESSKAHVQMHAESKESLLVSNGEKGIDASLGLTPLFSQRVLGNLLPLMVDLKQADDSKRAAVTLRNFQVPLSGDLRQLNGQVTLDLGTISYRFLPGIVDKFSGGAKSTASSTQFDPIAIQITKGVAHYDSLALPIAGKKMIFKGTFDLVTKTYKMSTKLPLAMLGKSALGALGKAADILGPDTEVPINITGTSSKPSFSIDDSFVEDALKKAAGNALGDLFGKKKK